MTDEKRITSDDVEILDKEQLNWLSDNQLSLCHDIRLDRANKRVNGVMKKILEPELDKIAACLSSDPFIYVTPEFQVMPGCKIALSTLMRKQFNDAHAQLEKFIDKENPNNLRATDALNNLLLAHSLVKYNGSNFGALVFDVSEYQGLLLSDPSAAQQTLSDVRDARIAALDNLSPQVHQRIVEYYYSFQVVIEEVTRGEDMDTALGN